MTLGGLIQVAAHGTGMSIPTMDEIVLALKLMDASGEIKVLDERDGDIFKAAKVSLGTCGALLQVQTLL